MNEDRHPPAFTDGRPVDAIVVPVAERDRPDRALPLASHLARRWELPMRLVHVSGSISSDDDVLDAAKATVRGRWPGVTVQTSHVQGDDPAIALAGAIGAAALPVLSTEHADGWSFKHSVAEALVDRVGVPAVLLGPRVGRDLPSGDVVAALDASPAADATIAAGATLAGALGRRLWLVRILADGPAPGPDLSRTELHPEVGLELQRRSDALDPELRTRWEVIHGNDPVRAIESFANRIDASLVVAATRGRTDETRTTMRSITMGLVAAAARPILVIQADHEENDDQADVGAVSVADNRS